MYGIDEVDFIFEEFEEENLKTVESYKSNLLAIRAGRANPHVLDKITVDYYGTQTPLIQMGNITVAEARLIVISVYDKSALKNVEKAILAANIGINPNNDGNVIRLVFPEVTEERRRALVKDIKTDAENCKVAIRNHRRDANRQLEVLKKNSTITEDDLKKFLEDIDKVVSSETENIDKLCKTKEQEIMSV